jgi:hypothetical protein
MSAMDMVMVTVTGTGMKDTTIIMSTDITIRRIQYYKHKAMHLGVSSSTFS